MGKVEFAPLPPRAIGNTELSALALRVLAAIAYHDRLSRSRRQGAGCWAGNPTLARKCCCHESSLSTAITQLAQRGYITREPHPINRRLRVFRVVYEAPESASIPSQVGEQSGSHHLPVAKQSHEPSVSDCSPESGPKAETVCHAKPQGPELNGESDVEYIPPKREEITPKREHIRHKTRSAFEKANGNMGGFLAMVERALRESQNTMLDVVTQRHVEVIAQGDDCDEPLRQQAERILQTWGT